MIFRQLFRSSEAGGSRRLTQQSSGRCRLGLEALDDRIVPASLSVGDTAVVEGDGTTQIAVVSVTLNAPSNRSVSVNYATANGTAKSGSDYGAASGKLIFAPGETVKTVIDPHQ